LLVIILFNYLILNSAPRLIPLPWDSLGALDSSWIYKRKLLEIIGRRPRATSNSEESSGAAERSWTSKRLLSLAPEAYAPACLAELEIYKIGAGRETRTPIPLSGTSSW